MRKTKDALSGGAPALTRLWSVTVLASVVTLVVAGCGNSSSSSSATGGGGANCSNLNIALMAPLTGDQGVFGAAGVDMGQWVLDNFNKAHPSCHVGLKKFDTQGDPTEAAALARKVANDPTIVGVVGPTNSGEVESAAPILEAAGVPFVTPQATAKDLSSNGWKYFHRTVGNDGQEGPADARYIVKNLHSTKVAVIDDGIPYGVGLADIVASTLKGLSAQVVDRESIDISGTDYTSTVNRVIATNPQAVFCGCLYAEAGRFLKQLRAAGYQGHVMGGAGTFVPQIVSVAGTQAAEGFTAGSAGQDPSQSAAGKAWVASWNKYSGGKQLGLYAPEFYNATVALTDAIGASQTSRQDVNTYLYPRTFQGATGAFAFDSQGNVKTTTVYFYEVKHGTFTFVYSVTV